MQCACAIDEGTRQCERTAQTGSQFCWQHRNCPLMYETKASQHTKRVQTEQKTQRTQRTQSSQRAQRAQRTQMTQPAQTRQFADALPWNLELPGSQENTRLARRKEKVGQTLFKGYYNPLTELIIKLSREATVPDRIETTPVVTRALEIFSRSHSETVIHATRASQYVLIVTDDLILYEMLATDDPKYSQRIQRIGYVHRLYHHSTYDRIYTMEGFDFNTDELKQHFARLADHPVNMADVKSEFMERYEHEISLDYDNQYYATYVTIEAPNGQYISYSYGHLGKFEIDGAFDLVAMEEEKNLMGSRFIAAIGDVIIPHDGNPICIKGFSQMRTGKAQAIQLFTTMSEKGDELFIDQIDNFDLPKPVRDEWLRRAEIALASDDRISIEKALSRGCRIRIKKYPFYRSPYAQ